MKHVVLVLLMVSFLLVGCGKKKVEEGPQEVIRPTSREADFLRMQYVDDPYSEKGQAMLRKMRDEQAELDKARQESEELRRKISGQEEPAANPPRRR